MTEGYSKITPFLSDVKVSKISAKANIPLVVARSGRKIKTRIILTPEEINEIFQVISSQANIPIINTNVQIALDNLKIEGQNTKDNNSAFTIYKNTAYSLLEGK